MKSLIKGFIKLGILLIIIGVTYNYREDIMKYAVNLIEKKQEEILLTYTNEYTRKKDYNYVKITNNFEAKSKNDFLNIYYTIIDSGIDEFSFRCSYDNCKDDIDAFASDQKSLSNINSFVHPYNSFTSIKTKYDSFNMVEVQVEKAYTKDQIEIINQKIEQIQDEELSGKTDKKEIIKTVHDYIINHSKYDSNRSDKNIKSYSSTIAYGPLIEGYGLCGGYTDAMALFLDLYDIPNFKVISENHIWNAVYLNNTWVHLDVTWDDPVDKGGRNILDYSFFLVKTPVLEKLEGTQHIYDKAVFSEVQ